MKGQKKWMVDHSGETDLDSGTESQKGRETGIKTETEVLVAVEGGLLKMEVEEEEVVIEPRGETGLQGGRRMELITGEVVGKETGIGKEIGIAKKIGSVSENGTVIGTGTGTVTVTATGTGIGTETETETVTVTVTDEVGKKGDAARIVSGGEGEGMMLRGIEGGVREENEEEEMVGVERGDEKLLEKMGTDQGDRNGERGQHGGIETIGWQN